MTNLKSLATALGFATLLALPTQAQTASPSANLSLSYGRSSDAFHLYSTVTGGSGDGVLLLLSITEDFSFGVIELGIVNLDFQGSGTHVLTLPPDFDMPPGMTGYIRGALIENSGVTVTNTRAFALATAPCESLGWNFAPGGVELQGGEEITDQYSSIGVTVSAINKHPFHPNRAILFDSANPTGDDGDLATPGYGMDNDEPFGNLLIVAENDFDGDNDGLIDSPDDEQFGSIITIDFAEPIQLCEIVLVDVDDKLDPTLIECMVGVIVQDVVSVLNGGDNSVRRVLFDPAGGKTDQLRVNFSGSGAIAEIKYVPCPTRADFDNTTTGIPLELEPGEVLTNQLEPINGMRVSAKSNNIGFGVDKAAVFDSSNPTGGDPDLMTPGTGVGNDTPLRQVIILTDNDVDADMDGLIDSPGDDLFGGQLTFEWDFDITFRGATVLDIEEHETSRFDLFDKDGLLIGVVPITGLGCNSAETVTADVSGVRKIVLELGGSGAVGDLEWCPDDVIEIE